MKCRTTAVLIMMVGLAAMASAADITTSSLPKAPSDTDAIMLRELQGDPAIMTKIEKIVSAMHDNISQMANQLKKTDCVKGDLTAIARMDGIASPVRMRDVPTADGISTGHYAAVMRNAHVAAQVRRMQTSMVDLMETMKNCPGIATDNANTREIDRLVAQIASMRGEPTTGTSRVMPIALSDENTSAPIGVRRQFRNLDQTQKTQHAMLEVIGVMAKIAPFQADAATRKTIEDMRARTEKMVTETVPLMSQCKKMMDETIAMPPQPLLREESEETSPTAPLPREENEETSPTAPAVAATPKTPPATK